MTGAQETDGTASSLDESIERQVLKSAAESGRILRTPMTVYRKSDRCWDIRFEALVEVDAKLAAWFIMGAVAAGIEVTDVSTSSR